MIPWKHLSLTNGARDINPTSERGLRALAEYRDEWSIKGVWLVSLDFICALTDEEDPADFGPTPDQIDWTGFAEMFATLA